MLEIDGEFFADPIEQAKKRKMLRIIMLTSKMAVIQQEMKTIMAAPLFPRQYNYSGEIIKPNA